MYDICQFANIFVKTCIIVIDVNTSCLACFVSKTVIDQRLQMNDQLLSLLSLILFLQVIPKNVSWKQKGDFSLQ